MQVDVGRLDRLMAEPDCSHGAVDPVLQQLHGSGVQQDVGSDALALRGGAGLPGNGHMLGHQAGESVVAESAAPLVREDRRVRLAAPFVQPGSQGRCGVLTQRRAAPLAALALAAQMRAVAELDVLAAKLDQLGRSQAWLHGNEQKRAVAAPGPRLRVRGLRLGLDLVAVEEVHGAAVVARDLLVTGFRGGALDAGGRAALLFAEGGSRVERAILHRNGHRPLRGGITTGVDIEDRYPCLRNVLWEANPDPRPESRSPALPKTLPAEGTAEGTPPDVGQCRGLRRGRELA